MSVRIAWLASVAVGLSALAAEAAPPALKVPPPPPEIGKLLAAVDGLAENATAHVLAVGCGSVLFLLNDYFTTSPGLTAATRDDGQLVLAQVAQFALVYEPTQGPQPDWKEQWKMIRANLDRVLDGLPPAPGPVYRQLQMPSEVREALARVERALGRADLPAAKSAIDEARVRLGKWLQEAPLVDPKKHWAAIEATLKGLSHGAFPVQRVKDDWNASLVELGLKSGFAFGRDGG